MMFFLISTLLIMITTPSSIDLRGIVEGFYGMPWTYEDRADLITFCGQNNLNSYIYAPKDDPYHRDKWREPYPEDKIKELEKLITVSRDSKVKFVFAVSPGLDLKYEGEEGEKDFNSLLVKLDSIYSIGGRDFAIFFDDISVKTGDGEKQAKFLNRLNAELKSKYSDTGALITVPTQYALVHMIDKDGNVKEYTIGFSTTLDKDIIVLYTGDGVVCDGISEESYQKAKDVYKRDLGIWWNYPVNDFLPTKLALGPIEKLPTTRIESIFYNPMQQVQLSKLSIATGAEYAASQETYDSFESWNKVIDAQFGEIAWAMKVFAKHSMHMENSWAFAGPADAPEFYNLGHQAIIDTKDQKTVDFGPFIKLVDEMDNAANALMEKLDKKILFECSKQIAQFKRIIDGSRVAIKCLKEKKLDNELLDIRKDIDNHRHQAILSEKSGIKFLDEVLDLFKNEILGIEK